MNTAPGQLPLISVVVPSYNQGHFLRDTLESIFRQGYPRLEVVVMDGGSTDGSVEIIRSHAHRLKHWQSGRDGGQSAAINAGVRHCSGDVVNWLNSDDYYWGDALWTVGRAYAAHPGYGLYVGNGLRCDQRTGRHIPFIPRHAILNRTALLQGPDYLLQPSTFVLREAWERLGGLDSGLSFCMDWDLYLRISRQYPAVLVNEFLGVSREYEETKTRSGKMRRAVEILHMVQRHSETELTPGTLHYLLDTLRDVTSETMPGELPELFQRAVGATTRHFCGGFGGGHWSPERGDPQDRVYLPVASGDLPLPCEDSGLLPSLAPDPWPLITVVVPSFNHTGALRQTLDSVLHQDYPHREIVVVDGGSTDGSADLLRSYADRVIRHGCPPPWLAARAVNQGLKVSRGEVLAWLQPGDRLAWGALREAARAFADDAGLGVVYGNALYVDERDQPYLVDLGSHRSALVIGAYVPAEPPSLGLPPLYAVPQATVCFRRSLWEQCGPLDESYRRIFDLEMFTRYAARTAVRKLERTQAVCRVGQADDPHWWTDCRAELYRLSRSRWPGVFRRGFRAALRRYLAGYMRRRFRGRRGLGFWTAAALVAFSALTRLGNPERWWTGRLPEAPDEVPPLSLPVSLAGHRPAPPFAESSHLADQAAGPQPSPLLTAQEPSYPDGRSDPASGGNGADTPGTPHARFFGGKGARRPVPPGR